jgi:hypothetical protein
MEGVFEARRELKMLANDRKIIEVVTEDDVESDEVLMIDEDFEVQDNDHVSWKEYLGAEDGLGESRRYKNTTRNCATWKNSNHKAPRQWARHKKLQHSYSAMSEEFLKSFLAFQAEADAYDAYIEHCHAVWLARIDSLLTDDDFDAEDVDLDIGSQTKLNQVYRHAA